MTLRRRLLREKTVPLRLAQKVRLRLRGYPGLGLRNTYKAGKAGRDQKGDRVNPKNNLAYLTVRVLTGLMFVVIGGMKFFPQLAQAPPGAAGEFMTGMMAAGYFLPFLAVAEVIIGAMILLNQWPALAAVMLMPISLNVLLFNAFLLPAMVVMGIVPFLFNAYLLYYHWDAYRPMLARKPAAKTR